MSDELKTIGLGMGAAGAAGSLFLIEDPQDPLWKSRGKALLAGKGLSESTYKTISDVGMIGANAGVLGYYLSQFAADPKNKSNHQRILGLANTYAWSIFTTTLTKKLVARERPDRSDNLSFFSGHTSNSVAPSVYHFLDLHHTYGKRHPALTYSLGSLNLVLSAVTGVSRNGANRHYIEDIAMGAITGAAIGVGSYYAFNQESTPDNKTNGKYGLIGGVVTESLAIAGSALYYALTNKSSSKKLPIQVMPLLGAGDSFGMGVGGRF
ncbi:hypothetical protein BVY03_01685 [bacterium K02(2017)]|nr:hypothetical protein BVY03_01685 [bacterium K02(2017)]